MLTYLNLQAPENLLKQILNMKVVILHAYMYKILCFMRYSTFISIQISWFPSTRNRYILVWFYTVSYNLYQISLGYIWHFATAAHVKDFKAYFVKTGTCSHSPTAKRSTIGHSMCGNLKNPRCSMTMIAEHTCRSKFAALQR